MYSYEIDELLKFKNYNIDSETYMNICSTSPQISLGKYEPYDSHFELWTDDGYHWMFTVYKKEY